MHRYLTLSAPLWGLLLLASCGDSHTPTALTTRGAHRLTRDDSVAHGYFASPSSRTRSLAVGSVSRDVVTGAAVSLVSMSPSSFQGYAQPETITGVVSGPVASVTVVGNGAIQCSGDYGNLIAYDASGALLASVPLQLIDPSDCSPPDNPDNVTYGATATLTVPTGIIARFEITPMSPMTFTVLGQCCGHPSQTYSVSLGAGTAPSTLTITPTTLTVDPYSAGQFTAAAGPGATITGIQWQMIDAQGNVTSCPGVSLTCGILIKRNGRLTVTASVDGVRQQASADITVNTVPCPTGDSLLDLPQVQHVLSQAWTDSRPTDPMANRRERGGWILLDPATGALTAVPAYDPNATPCTNVAPLPAGSPPLVIVAQIHTHPFADREPLPANCPQTGRLGFAYDAQKFGGPSKGDWDYVNTSPDPSFSVYVEDKNNLYRAVQISPVTPQNALANVQQHPYPATCR